MSPPEPHFPARFAPGGFEEDRAASTDAGRAAAKAARTNYERAGIPRSHLRPCDIEGRDGTRLPDCYKVRVPHPNGRWGMVFKAQVIAGRPRMDFVAFGVRHHPAESHALSVYEVASRRLNG